MHYREYIKATGINLLFTFAIFIYYPVLSPYIKSVGLDNFQLALIFSILPLVTIFSSPIMGRLSDNVGRSRVIIFGLIIEIISMILYLIGSSWILFAIARVLDAIAFAAVTLIAIAKIEDSLSNKERGKFAGWSLSLAQIGALVGPVVGGLLADMFFIKAPFILSSFILLILAFLLVFRTKKNDSKIEKKNFNIIDELKLFLSIRPLKGMAILGMVMHATNPAMKVFIPLFIIETFNLSYSYVGIAIFFLGLAHLFQFLFGGLSDRFGRSTMVLFGCSVFAFFMFFLGVTSSFWILLVLLFFQGIGGAIWNVSAWSLMSDVGEKIGKEGEVVGSYMSLAKIGGFVSFLISGLIVELFGMRILFMVNGCLIAGGILLASFYLYSRVIPVVDSKTF